MRAILAADLAVAVGFRQPNDWRFPDLARSANQYGLVSIRSYGVDSWEKGVEIAG
jgi:hypothetical protein